VRTYCASPARPHTLGRRRRRGHVSEVTDLLAALSWQALPAGVRNAYATFAGTFGTALQGVLLQPMAEPGRELIVGVDSDAVFGPLVVFGLGGTDTDLIADRAARLTPLSDVDVERMVHGLRSSAALFGSGGLPADGLVDKISSGTGSSSS
jgi:hypothetical protein